MIPMPCAGGNGAGPAGDGEPTVEIENARPTTGSGGNSAGSGSGEDAASSRDALLASIRAMTAEG